jgi:hypothetical protein
MKNNDYARIVYHTEDCLFGLPWESFTKEQQEILDQAVSALDQLYATLKEKE